MADNSPTDTGADTTGSQSSDLPENQQDHSAEQQHDTGSGDNSQGADHTSSDSAANASTDNGDDSSSNDDDGLAKFAKAQGFDPDNLTDGEKRALKIAHDNQKAYRKSKEDDAGEKLGEALSDVNSVSDEELDNADPDEAETIKLRAEMAELRAENRKNAFFKKNPDAANYEDEMKDILVREIETNGKDAARYLASDLNRLYILAKAEAGDGTDTAVAEARRAEREELRRKQEGSAGGAPAASQSNQAPKKIDRAWLESTYDPTNSEHRQLVDEALARGDLY